MNIIKTFAIAVSVTAIAIIALFNLPVAVIDDAYQLAYGAWFL